MMRKDTLIGLIGVIFGMCAALYIILSANSPAIELTGVQVALFSALGMGGSGIVAREPRFGGWMMLMSASFLAITAPLSSSPAVPASYLPAIICFGVAGILALRKAGSENGR